MNHWKPFAMALSVAITLAVGSAAGRQALPSGAQPTTCFRPDERSSTLASAPCDRKVLEAAARKGEVYAQNQLGLVSALLVNNRQDLRRARSWFEKAAREGYAPAQVNLGVLYVNGWGVQP